MTSTAVCPGSFDPVTLGHLDVFAKAARIFDDVIALVVHNPKKNPAFSLQQRVEFLRAALDEAGLSRVRVDTLSEGLLVEYCHQQQANVLVKGIRGDLDVSYETPMAIVNRNLGAVETVFLLPEPEHSHVSSSLVRTLAGFGGDVSPYVPEPVARHYREHPRQQ
ncbi:pantetheine-phosphate adenylyltransferase [Pseudoclavibacter sp. 13-3]|uniref:pantetheine-phosphate adenylyltransferase n=1 Tax=Pseudoclavibacter sp. 13-3 TaxID=2901228 RepID=UPI001E45677F|nr:pantetheine-phosphate adenylyltransferase [Pseudoclavibacter sp. 13-3]MCD7100909.1 pantetheine-phosphate adenylyltransferase [Pseudoclavibacter sp. 13-3]